MYLNLKTTFIYLFASLLCLVEASTISVMYSKNIYIDEASWIQSNPVTKYNAKTLTECSTFCTSNLDYCSAFVFLPNETCQNSMPASLIEFTSDNPAIFPRITVWRDKEKTQLKRLTVCNGVNNMKCIFPYVIDGLPRNMCFQGGGGLACATQIDVTNGNKQADSYADDNCFLDNGAGCTSKNNHPCIFPYIRNGKNVTGCRRSPGNDGSSCSFKLNPDGTFIGNWFWGATEDWCSFDCLKYNSAQDRKFNFYHLLMAVAITLQAKIVGW